MGRKNDVSNSTSVVDQYRKQLGRQEKKTVNERRKEIKRLKSEKENVSYWKVKFYEIIIKKNNFISLGNYMDIGCGVILNFYYLCNIYVLFSSKRLNDKYVHWFLTF